MVDVARRKDAKHQGHEGEHSLYRISVSTCKSG